MRTRMYGGVRGRKTKVGGKLLLFSSYSIMDRLEFYAVVVRTESFECRSVKFFLMVRMSDADEQFCALLH